MRTVVSVAVLCLCMTGPAVAESPSPGARVATSIPAQELGAALQLLAKQRDFQIVCRADLLKDLYTQGISGDLTADEALMKLLSGTGLIYRRLDEHTVTIIDGSSPETHNGAPHADGDRAGGGNEISLSNAAGKFEEIVVTARKRAETTLEVPATISIFNREALDEAGADSISDIQHSIPNFFYTSQRPFVTTLTMRGMGAALAVPGVGMYIDGAYQLGTTAFTLPLYDVERVEILKGPQGTLYGRNSFAGVINYVTRAPSDELSADLSAEVGNGGTYKGSASVSGPLVGDVLSGRISVGVQRRDGFRDYSDGSDADTDDYNAVNGVLAARPFENFQAKLRYAYIDKSGGSFQYHTAPNINSDQGRLLVTTPFQVGPLAGHRNGDQGLTLESYNLNMTWSFGAADLISVSTYDDNSNFVYYDSDIAPGDAINALTQGRTHAWSQELRLQSTGRSAFSWLVAAYYGEGASDGSNTLGGILFAPGLFQPYGKSTFESRAVFTDLEYALNEQWSIGAGVRYDVIKKVSGTLDGEFSDTQPKFTVKYRYSDDGQIYATAAKGFREGGFVATMQGTPFESYPNDELWSYELGMKSRFADRRGNLDLAVFYIDARSLNGTALVNTPLGARLITVPIGQAESYGVELTSSFAVTDSFSLNLLGGYNKATPTQLVSGVQPGTAVLGEQMINAPKWNVRLGGTLDLPLAGTRGFKLQASVNAVGPTNFLGENLAGAPLTERDPYYLVDVRASYKWRNYSLTAFVENATDTVYAADYRPVSTSQPFGGGTMPGVLYNLPRYYGLSFRVQM